MTFDFLFSRITNVNFGHDWFGIGFDNLLRIDSPGATATVEIDFPGMAAGTPGLQAWPNNFGAFPRNVTPADLKHQVLGGAGFKFTTFGVTGINRQVVELKLRNVDTTGYNNGTEIYIQIPSGSPFPVRVSMSQNGAPSTPTLVGFYLPSNLVKAGLFLPIASIPRTEGDFLPPGNSWTSDFVVDPHSKRITYQG